MKHESQGYQRISNLLVLLASLFLAGCDRRPEDSSTGSTGERPAPIDVQALKAEAALSELRELEMTRISLNESLQAQQSRARAYADRAASLEAQLEDLTDRVQAYILDHKMAVASIAAGVGGAAVALDDSFTEDEQGWGAVAGIAGAAYAVWNADEVAEVTDQLLQASQRAENLEQRIATARANHTKEAAAMAPLRQQLEHLNSRANALRTTIQSLLKC